MNGWMTLKEVGQALGVPHRSVYAHLHDSYSWLPCPRRGLTASGESGPLMWPRRETEEAIRRGRPRLASGWHRVEHAGADVWVARSGERPSKMRLLVDYNGGLDVSDRATEVERWCHSEGGALRYVDSGGPIQVGMEYPLRDYDSPMEVVAW